MNKLVAQILVLIFVVPLMVFAASSKDEKVMIIRGDDGPWLGVQIEDLSDKMLRNLYLDNGVRVKKVLEDSPAEKAGIEEDDILISYNGKKVHNSEELVNVVRKSAIDDEVTIGYYRDGKQKEVSVKIAKKENRNIMRWYGNKAPHKSFKFDKRAWLGVKTESLNDQLREYFAAPADLGVLVKEVIKDSPAENVGLKAGDVIIKVADRDIENSRDLVRSINYYNPDEVVEITVIREKNEKRFRVKLGETKGSQNFHFYGMDDDLIEMQEFDFTVPDIDMHHDIDVEIDTKSIEEIEDKSDKIDKDIKVKKIQIKINGDEA
jgi:predicted metalloprotease with PDZ domain